MPIIATPNIFANPDVEIAIWEITESEEQLMQLCNHNLIANADALNIKLEKRRKEILVEHLLLHSLFGNSYQLTHQENGAPKLNKNINLSITHSMNYVAIAVSKQNIGIDIEQLSNKVIRVRNKFLSELEQQALPLTDLTANTVAWTAKEALYKAAHIDGIALANGLCIDAMAIAKSTECYKCHIGHNRWFSTYSTVFNNHAMSLTIEKE